jgi:predicted phosphoadenosine phosphosulfate sulfurtransferase
MVAPIGRWFLVEAFMHQAMDNSGQVTFWIDGALLVDVTGVSTVPTMWLSWNVGGSASNIAEPPAEIFLDDAAITRTRP